MHNKANRLSFSNPAAFMKPMLDDVSASLYIWSFCPTGCRKQCYISKTAQIELIKTVDDCIVVEETHAQGDFGRLFAVFDIRADETWKNQALNERAILRFTLPFMLTYSISQIWVKNNYVEFLPVTKFIWMAKLWPTEKSLCLTVLW